MDRIKEGVDADPYKAVFGSRFEPFNLGLGLGLGGFKLENKFTSLCRSLFGLEEKPEPEAWREKDTETPVKTAQPKVKAKHGVQGDYHHIQDLEMAWETERQWDRGFAGLTSEYDYDPITGRMVHKSPEPLMAEKSKEHGLDAPATKDLKDEEHGVLADEKSNSDSNSPSESALVDSSKTEASNTPGAENEYKEASEIADTHQCQTSDLPLMENTQTSMSEPSETSQDAIVTTKKDDQNGMPPENFDDAFYRGRAVQHSRDFDLEDSNFPERLVERDQEGLDRLGFLARRDLESLDLSEGDKDLEGLRASDIRAAYEPRRQAIESEIVTETIEKGAESSSPIFNGVEDRSNSFTAQQEPSGLAGSFSASSPSSEQVPTEPPSQPAAPATSSSAGSWDIYRIFAYEPSSSRITEAETMTSLEPPSEHVHPTQVLNHLENPAKFLPCLSQMRAEGYEIVSGGGDILVFRRASQTGRSTPQEETLPAKDDHDLSGAHSSTAQSKRNPPRSRLRRVLGRMLFSGLATAGTCYAIGVVSLYFRTGGEEGWGVDAFTVFESERRHRD